MTPTGATFAAAYMPPDLSAHKHDHSHDHSHDHDHGGKRSFLTKFLLQYTSNQAIFHAILSDKDSRRIFYFMS
jgi:solute carrier family 30 (zinc transporter), member 5/7